MFKVPSDPDAPSFDQTYTVGFMRWLTSSAADRREWRIRRDIANRLRAERARVARDARYQPQLADLRARAAQLRAEISAQWAGRPR